MADDGYTEKQWVYAGRRIAGDEMGYAWANPEIGFDERDLLVFKKAKAYAVGDEYTLQIKHENGSYFMRGNPVYEHNDGVADELRDKWRLLDRAAETTKTQLQREAKARREGSDFGSLTLEQVRTLMHGPKASGLLAQVLRYLNAA